MHTLPEGYWLTNVTRSGFSIHVKSYRNLSALDVLLSHCSLYRLRCSSRCGLHHCCPEREGS